jgi:3-mercaptopyruvate sulfurtransferase SseA
MHKWLITAAGSMLFASIACGQYKTNQAPPPTTATPAPTPTVAVPAQPPPAIINTDPNEAARRIMRDEAIKMVKDGKAVWVDVRAKDQFDIEHIKGAINYPLTDLETDLAADKAGTKLPKNKFLITYCA